uniref:Valine--tRNA ligase n=1 Tax=Electrophorus electricus TaxID=8005 RepID=A0A4W4GSG5_ELEEL
MWKSTSGRCFRAGTGSIHSVWTTWGDRLCSQTTAPPPSSSLHPLRSQAEKAKRKNKREKAILSSNVDNSGVKWSEKERAIYTGATLPGEKKDTTLPLPQTYSPKYVESCWYHWWEKEELFSPEKHREIPHAVDKYFSLCIPPPNVTGALHLGHALTVAIEDSLARWRRMQGYKVLWVPGCDHAGIATQSVVERRLLRDYGKRRQEYCREEFLQEVWKWKKEKGDEIYHQLRQLGASLDWSRACFTLDPGFSRAVTEAFVRMCDLGLIYRSESLVNWSCSLESAVSDVEVNSKQLSGKTLLSIPGYQQKVEFGTMVTFAYPIEGNGDEAYVLLWSPLSNSLCDVTYCSLHGQKCRHPFTNRLLPIITDTVVDMEIGTGAVKLTPAHDFTDFVLAQRHSLPRLTVIGGDGTMTSLCGQWLKGVKRFEAREKVIGALMEKKLFRGKRDHAMYLPICSRSGDVIEPLLKKQWFVRCEGMAQKAIQAVDEGALEIIPHFYTKIWKNWLSNISDWCISRQLWWGHQIPAYRVSFPDSDDTQEEKWVCASSDAQARERAAIKFGVSPDAMTLTQDPDVLDTWFSSALFPFAILGWPQQTEDMKQFYPNTVLETGSDLIFFWVARMVMLGTELTGQLPFKQVLFHSLVRDKYGRKMSKSLGNVVDPLDVISGVSLEGLQKKVMEGNLDPREKSVAMEAQRKDFPEGIPECGTDALRFALCSYKAQGEDISLSMSRVLGCRHFCNKMWQTVRFTLGALVDTDVLVTPLSETSPVSSIDRWICSRLSGTVQQCESSFESYQLHAVTSALHSFWLHDLCDVYLECIKPVLKQQDMAARQVATAVLYHCVSLSLCLLSPFMPFLTEELWQRLQPYGPDTNRAVTSVCVQPYPKASQLIHWQFPQEEVDFPLVKEVVRVARSLRAQYHITKERPDMWAVCTPDTAQTLYNFSHAICVLGRISNLYLHCPLEGAASLPFFSAPPPPERSFIGVAGHSIQLHLDVQKFSNADKQVTLLSQRREKLLSKLQRFLSQTKVPDYTEKAPEHIQQETQNKIAALEQELKSIDNQLLVLKDVKNAPDS